MGANTDDHKADYSSNAVKKLVLEQKWILLDPIKEGLVPSWIPPLKSGYFAKPISYLTKSHDHEATRMLPSLMSLQDRVTSFNPKVHDILNPTSQDILLTQFGSKCAEDMEKIVQGYINIKDTQCPKCPNAEKGVTRESWHRYISPLRYFNDKTTMRKDEKTGIYLPMDLNIKED